MSSLFDRLPKPSPKEASLDEYFEGEKKIKSAKSVSVPSYGNRKGFRPKGPEDFGNGGAFPEIHVPQYPLGMGLKDSTTGVGIISVGMSDDGTTDFAGIVTQGQRKGKIVHTKKRDGDAKRIDMEFARPDELEVKATTQKTREALEALISGKLQSTIASKKKETKSEKEDDAKYIKYKPANQGEAFNSGFQDRLIRMVELPKDPLEPARFKNKKIPRPPASPPVPVMHSPPRKPTAEELEDFRIPPCVPGWKNVRGFTVPLEKRMLSEGLQDVHVSDRHAKLSEAMFIAARKQREELAERARMRQKIAAQERELEDEKMRRLAEEARRGISSGVGRGYDADGEHRKREERIEDTSPRRPLEHGRGHEDEIDIHDKGEDSDDFGDDDHDSRVGRDDDVEESVSALEDRNMLRRERERERRRELRLKKRAPVERERDVSERIALGMGASKPTADSMYDQRLFNQSSGLDSGFKGDDVYDVYDQPFNVSTSAHQIYRPTGVGGSEGGGRDRPVEFEEAPAESEMAKEGEGKREMGGTGEVEEDPFGFGDLGTVVQTKRQRGLDEVGKSGHMTAAAGGSSLHDSDAYRDVKRARVDFVRATTKP